MSKTTYALGRGKIMQTFTFDTIIQNGMISVPNEYRHLTEGTVTVTIEKEESVKPRKEITFNAIKLDTRGFKFNREEANARR